MTHTETHVIDGITITHPKATQIEMVYLDYKIALALGKVLVFEKNLKYADADALVKTFEPIFSKYQNPKDWRYPFSTIFRFDQAFDAELLATAIHWYHGSEPTVTISYPLRQILVGSIGYAAW